MSVDLSPAAIHGREATLLLEVADAEPAAPGIRTLRLRSPDGERLPSFPPGSHIVVDCGTRRNAYSLTGPGREPETYAISVLLRPDSDGGSEFLHRVRAGELLRVSRPRSAFAPVATARRHLYAAGGIGITPLLSHVRAATEWGRPFELLYAHRPGAGAHAAELRELCGERLREFPGRAEFQRALEDAARSQPLGTHLYVCGPAGLLDFVHAAAARAGWPQERVHAERFSAALDPGEPFTATLAGTGVRIPVPAGVSLLEALERAGTAVPSMCRQGVCGECRLRVLGGRPLHRDLYLSPEERAAGDAVMACVSRSHDEELELDL